MQAAENSASQSVGLADDGTLYFNVDYEYHYHSSYLDENEEPIEGLNHEWQLFKLDGSGLDTTGNVALLSGAYDDDPMLESGIQYEHHFQTTAQGDELSIGLYVPYNAPGNIAISGGGSIRSYHYSGFYQLRAMVREAGTEDKIVVSPLDYNLGNVYHAFGNLTHPVIMTQYYDNTMLVFHNGNYTRQNLTADPRTGERAVLSSLSGNSAIDQDKTFDNGRAQEAQKILSPDVIPGNMTMSPELRALGGALFGINVSGNFVLGVDVYIDPITHNSLDGYYANSTVPPINAIHNPAVIIMDMSAHPAILEAKIAAPLNDLIKWELDSDGSNLTGNVAFTDAEIPGHPEVGRVVKVYGTEEGRVRFRLSLLHWEVPLLPGVFNKVIGSNETVDDPHIMFEAQVGYLKAVPCRVNRLVYDVNGNSTAPSADDIYNKVLPIANTYLWQAGIVLLLDGNTTPQTGIAGVAISNTTVNGNVTSIFDLYTTGFWYPNIGLSDEGAVDLYGTSGPVGENFIYFNPRPYVMQISFLGRMKPDSNGKTYSGWAYYTAPQNDDFLNDSELVDKFVGTDPVRHLSHLAYIVSLRDNKSGPGGDAQALYSGYKLWTPHDLKFYGTNTSFSTFGCVLFTGTAVDRNAEHSSINPFILGQTIAHETGHVLGLMHRAGNVAGGLDASQDDQVDQLISGPSGSNLMDYAYVEINSEQRRNSTYFNPNKKNNPEDLDLHQVWVMRWSLLLGP